MFQITNDISALTFVNMGLSIVQIESINDDSKTLTVDLRLKLDWNDTRIQFKTNEEKDHVEKYVVIYVHKCTETYTVQNI